MFYCIVNPSARSEGRNTVSEKLEAALQKSGAAFRMIYTSGPGHASEAARQASLEADPEEPAVLVVLGGDGTLNETLAGIENFDAVRLGLIPVGSGNDFALGIGLSKNTDVLIRRIIQNKVTRRIDIGRLTYDHMTGLYARGRHEPPAKTAYFAVSMGIGYDAAVCEEAISSPIKKALNKVNLGKMTYGAIAVRQLVSAPKVHARIEVDGTYTYEPERMMFAALMNTPYEGGGYMFAPDASVTDGYLNLCLIGDIPKPLALGCFPLAAMGKVYGINGVSHCPGKHFEIRTDVPLWIHTDGEVAVKSDAVTIDCLPSRLSLIV